MNMIKFTARALPPLPEPSMRNVIHAFPASRDCWPRKPEFGGAFAAT